MLTIPPGVSTLVDYCLYKAVLEEEIADSSYNGKKKAINKDRQTIITLKSGVLKPLTRSVY